VKIVITGPESSGKTTLVEALSIRLEIESIPEFARSYLENLNNKYKYEDLLIIAKEQQKAIDNKVQNGNLLIVDTDLLTIKIWSEYKFGKCDEWIIQTLNLKKPDLYLLCKPDIPWEADPLRENQNDREELYQIYQEEIRKLEAPSVEISGSKEHRLSISIEAIQELINQS